MSKLQRIIEEYPDIEFLSADGFEEAIIGVCGEKLVYSNDKCIEILMTRDGMSFDEAIEYFEFNVLGAYVGEKTPIWVDDMFFD